MFQEDDVLYEKTKLTPTKLVHMPDRGTVAYSIQWLKRIAYNGRVKALLNAFSRKADNVSHTRTSLTVISPEGNGFSERTCRICGVSLLFTRHAHMEKQLLLNALVVAGGGHEVGLIRGLYMCNFCTQTIIAHRKTVLGNNVDAQIGEAILLAVVRAHFSKLMLITTRITQGILAFVDDEDIDNRPLVTRIARARSVLNLLSVCIGNGIALGNADESERNEDLTEREVEFDPRWNYTYARFREKAKSRVRVKVMTIGVLVRLHLCGVQWASETLSQHGFMKNVYGMNTVA